MKNQIKRKTLKRTTTLSFGMKSKEFVKSPLDAVIKFELIPIMASIQVLKPRNHQIYAINGDNCQMHVKDFLKTCGIAESTQNTDLANMVLGAGIGATVVGLAAIGFSILLRGKHN
jgi:exonuclease I